MKKELYLLALIAAFVVLALYFPEQHFPEKGTATVHGGRTLPR